MRAARLIRMVLLLQSRASMTAADLARELEVSERTVNRDALALSEAGIPVYADRGRSGGYRLVGGYRTRLTGLDREEAEALFLSGVPRALREMGWRDAASSACLKVSAALPPSLADAAGAAAQRFHLDAPGWFRTPDTPPLLSTVAEAVRHDRRVGVRYPSGEREVERELEPYGLVLKAGVWYLCARVSSDAGPVVSRDGPPEAGRGPGAARAHGARAGGRRAPDAPEFRVYRVERFVSVVPRAERFDRREDFDLPDFWAERAEEFARSLLRAEARVRLSPEGARRLWRAVGPLAAEAALSEASAPDASGRVVVTVPVESEEVAHDQLTGLGPEVEVLAPSTLRARFAEDALRSADLYRHRVDSAPRHPGAEGPARLGRFGRAAPDEPGEFHVRGHLPGPMLDP
ncbi:WYL domain-containing protein [Streptomyces sp. HSG2]|uniref:helix-turn-helix transcriptional regulator n=1 Tax=Streptomyces sp. HSG2 TaxID=2797167 RepID=UPI001905F488|nr:WYL domain-containing protein [Streptomyces sp. HSG2]